MEKIRIRKEVLKKFCIDVFLHYGLDKPDSEICSDVLVSADMKGISSHGVDALTRYISGIKEGIIIPQSKPIVVCDKNAAITVDARGGMGMVAGDFVIKKLIEKAEKYGIAMGTVRESNHFAFGAYYAEQACKKDMIGLSYSNTAAIAVPTNATIPMIGSNPISFAAPSNIGTDFVLDMGTSVVTRGAVKMHADQGDPIQEGWAVNKKGEYVIEPDDVLKVLFEHSGGLVPLGGKDVLLGGHKGYGLSVMVDILTGGLSGFKNSYQISDTKAAAGRSAQSYVVINISFFRDVDEFKTDIGNLITALSNTPAVEGKKVLFHGQLAAEQERYQEKHGIRLSLATYASLQEIGDDIGINLE